MESIRLRAGIAAAAIVLGFSTSATAQGPVVSGYGGAGAVASDVASPTVATSGDALPGTAGNVGSPDSGVPAPAPAAGAAPNIAVPAVDAAGTRLPFTGFDLALIIVGGLLLMIVGVGARWISRTRMTSP